MQDIDFVNGLIDFIKNSPTPFHAVETMTDILDQHGYTQLQETDQWSLQSKQVSGERYYVTRNDSSIVAFKLNQSLAETGIRMLGGKSVV